MINHEQAHQESSPCNGRTRHRRVALLITGFFVIRGMHRDAAVARLEEMGATVKIDRVTDLLDPIPRTVCWVDFHDAELSEQELDELVALLDQLNISDLRVSTGWTQLTDMRRRQLMEVASHLGRLDLPRH